MSDEQTEMSEEQGSSQTLIDVPVVAAREADEGTGVPAARRTIPLSDQEPPAVALPLRMRPAPIRKRTRRAASFKPAYLMLVTAVVVVGVLSVLLFQSAAGLLAQVPSLFSQSAAQKTPVLTSQGKVDLRPTFPTPGGGQGGQQSNLPPAYVQPTMAGVPTADATAVPTTTIQSGSFTLQFTAVPAQVNNFTTVQISVLSSEPGVSVKLQVIYNVAPYTYTSGAVANDAGLATLNWSVHIITTIVNGHALAGLTVTAQDQNGQQVSTQMITVQINTLGGG